HDALPISGVMLLFGFRGRLFWGVGIIRGFPQKSVSVHLVASFFGFDPPGGWFPGGASCPGGRPPLYLCSTLGIKARGQPPANQQKGTPPWPVRPGRPGKPSTS